MASLHQLGAPLQAQPPGSDELRRCPTAAQRRVAARRGWAAVPRSATSRVHAKAAGRQASAVRPNFAGLVSSWCLEHLSRRVAGGQTNTRRTASRSRRVAGGRSAARWTVGLRVCWCLWIAETWIATRWTAGNRRVAGGQSTDCWIACCAHATIQRISAAFEELMHPRSSRSGYPELPATRRGPPRSFQTRTRARPRRNPPPRCADK